MPHSIASLRLRLACHFSLLYLSRSLHVFPGFPWSDGKPVEWDQRWLSGNRAPQIALPVRVRLFSAFEVVLSVLRVSGMSPFPDLHLGV